MSCSGLLLLCIELLILACITFCNAVVFKLYTGSTEILKEDILLAVVESTVNNQNNTNCQIPHPNKDPNNPFGFSVNLTS